MTSLSEVPSIKGWTEWLHISILGQICKDNRNLLFVSLSFMMSSVFYLFIFFLLCWHIWWHHKYIMYCNNPACTWCPKSNCNQNWNFHPCRNAISSALESRSLNIDAVDVFLASSKTPLPKDVDCYPLGGNNLHVRCEYPVLEASIQLPIYIWVTWRHFITMYLYIMTASEFSVEILLPNIGIQAWGKHYDFNVAEMPCQSWFKVPSSCGQMSRNHSSRWAMKLH